MFKKIPKHIIEILEKLEKAGYEAYIVGGCVRDLMMENPPASGPNDWDITTNAKPEEILKLFETFGGGTKENPGAFYENDFGTVGIKINQQPITNKQQQDIIKEVVEVTTYRIESKYSDKRRPDKVKFAKTLEEDLSRRDFTVNAIALKIKTTTKKLKPIKERNSKKLPVTSYQLLVSDLFNGQTDIKNKIIRAVGNADERFNEDALRMMRAIRFATTLNHVAWNIKHGTQKPVSVVPAQAGIQKLKANSSDVPDSRLCGNGKYSNLKIQKNWKIEGKTFEAIRNNAKNLKYISQERIKDELSKIILSDKPAEGIDMLRKTGLLRYIIPELEKGIGMKQNRHHIHTIYRHNLLSLKYCPSSKLEVRLAALFHDIAKPQTKRGEGFYATFYNHDHVGARVAEKILKRLRFSSEVVQKVKVLINNHMFYYNPEEVGEASVRKLIKKVGLENMKDLIDLRVADRLGSGVPKAKPYKLRHLEYLIDKVSKDPVSVKMLKVNGNDLIKNLKINPGPKIGAILDVLLAEVIEDVSKNNKKNLLKRAEKLNGENISQLRKLAKEKIEERKEEEDKELKGRHWVK